MKKLYISFILYIFGAVWAMAQSFSPTDAQKFRLEAFNTLYQYQQYLNWINNDDDRDSFCRLFTDDDNLVYNDLIGFNAPETMTAFDYSVMLNELTRLIEAEVKDVRMGEIEVVDGEMVMPVTFNKSIKYQNACKIWLKSDSYYADNGEKKDYTLTAYFVYDKAKGKAKIRNIDGYIASSRPRLTDNFIAIRSINRKDDAVKVNGQTLEYDNQIAIFPNTTPEQLSLQSPDPDMSVRLVKDAERCDNVYVFKYKLKPWRFKLWWNMSMGDFYKVTTNTDFNFNGIKSSGMELGVDMGYTFPSSSSFKIGLFFGLGYSMSNMDLSLTTNSYSFVTSEDIDNDTYTRTYSNVSVNQKQDLTDLVVPLYFDLGINVGRATIFADLGAKLYYAMGSKNKTIDGRYAVNGVYSQYDGLVLGQEAGINGFTNSGTISATSVEVLDFERKSISIDVMGTLGVRFPIAKSILFEIAGGYQRSIGDCYTNTNTYYPCDYTVSKGENVNIFRSVTNISREFIKLNAGIIFKF